jgi:hypothetical protein
MKVVCRMVTILKILGIIILDYEIEKLCIIELTPTKNDFKNKRIVLMKRSPRPENLQSPPLPNRCLCR